MYFFDTADYYENCLFGNYAHLGNFDIQYFYEDVWGGQNGPGTMDAFLESIQQLILASKCPEGIECSPSSDEVIQNLMDAQLAFLKEAHVFWNMFKNPVNWSQLNTGQIIHAGIVSTSIVLKNFASDTPNTITVSENIDYGNAVKSYEYIDNYTEAFKTFNCEVKKAVSYFTNTTFEMPDITNYHYIDENDYNDYIDNQP